MRQVDEYFYTSPDEPLYHYTGVGSLEGIAKNRKIWASHIYYLNDSKEMIHACDVLQQALPQNPNFVFGDDRNSYHRFLKDIESWTNHLRILPQNLFIFSLSQQRSLLSQWRSYTPHGKGVSIGFSTALVRKIAEENNMRLGKCVYDFPTQLQLVESLISKLWTTCGGVPSTNVGPDSFLPFFESQRNEILQVLALIKHEAFIEEQEWRLISALHPTPERIQFRQGPGASFLVPYIELELSKEDYLFDLVILGPTPHEYLASSALLLFLIKHKFSGNLEESKIPYRVW